MNVVVVKRTESIGGVVVANVVLQALMQYCKGEKHNVGCSNIVVGQISLISDVGGGFIPDT